MTTMKAIWLASLITTINVLVASGFAIGAIIRSAIPCPCRIHSNRGVVAIRDVRGGAHNCSGFCSHWGRSTSRRRLRCRSWVPSPSPCKCWMPGIGLFQHDPGKCVGPLFIDIPNSSWCICFPDPGGSRRKPTADKRKLRRGISKFAPAAQVKLMQRITRPFISLRDNLSVGSFSQFDRSCSPHTPRAQLRSRPAGG